MNFNLLGTQLCNFCIKAMKYGCATLGISYGLLNILLISRSLKNVQLIGI